MVDEHIEWWLTDRVNAYIKEHQVECEWTPRKTFDACLTDDFSEYSAKALDGVRKSGSKAEVEVLTGEKAKAVSPYKRLIHISHANMTGNSGRGREKQLRLASGYP